MARRGVVFLITSESEYLPIFLRQRIDFWGEAPQHQNLLPSLSFVMSFCVRYIKADTPFLPKKAGQQVDAPITKDLLH